MLAGPTLRELQAVFAAALVGNSRVPNEVQGGTVPAAVRFSVHSNTVRASLRNAIAATFPVTRALAEPRTFDTIAGRFISAHPPDKGWLCAYGAAFPEFVADLPPATVPPYLADVAQLEWLRVAAANAPDTPRLDLSALARLSVDQLSVVRLRLRESAFLLRSNYPLLAIWTAGRNEAPGFASADTGGSPLLISQADIMVIVTALSVGESAFTAATENGQSLLEATAAAGVVDPSFNLASTLVRLCSVGALSAVVDQDASHSKPQLVGRH